MIDIEVSHRPLHTSSFHLAGRELCLIATPALDQALGLIPENIIQQASQLTHLFPTLIPNRNIWSYKKGVSLLLRDSIDPAQHICITDHKETVRERVSNTYFEFPGHAFFQDNNAILVPLTNYVRDAVSTSTSTDTTSPTHLVDAYCGSGLFSILLSPPLPHRRRHRTIQRRHPRRHRPIEQPPP